jgi:hypothetical protein
MGQQGLTTSFGAGDGNRTHVLSLGSSGPAIERRPQKRWDQRQCNGKPSEKRALLRKGFSKALIFLKNQDRSKNLNRLDKTANPRGGAEGQNVYVDRASISMLSPPSRPNTILLLDRLEWLTAPDWFWGFFLPCWIRTLNRPCPRTLPPHRRHGHRHPTGRMQQRRDLRRQGVAPPPL